MDEPTDKSRHNSDEPAAENEPSPYNLKKIPKRPVAVALEDSRRAGAPPKITAAGRGKIAEQILQLAWENGIKVREDSALAEMLAKIELDSPVPSEALIAVAEILSYIYRASGEPNPFDAVLEDAMKEDIKQNINDADTADTSDKRQDRDD